MFKKSITQIDDLIVLQGFTAQELISGAKLVTKLDDDDNQPEDIEPPETETEDTFNPNSKDYLNEI